MKAQDLGLNVKKYRVIEGPYNSTMEQLVQASYTLWGTVDIIKARNKAVGTDYQNTAFGNFFDSDFGIASNGKTVYVAPHSKLLRKITPEIRLINGGLVLTAEQHSKMKQYSKSDLILGRALREEEAHQHPLWLDFANGSQNTLDKYVENTFRLGKDKLDYDIMMGIYVAKDSNLRAVVLYSIDDRSSTYGSNDLNDNTRLVGVRRISE